MSLFKKRIAFPQFLADLISYQCDFLAGKFDQMIPLADEMKVLTKEDKEQFFDKAHALLIADIGMRCCQYFSKNVPSKEVWRGLGMVYGNYMTEYKKIPSAQAEQKVESVMALCGLVDKAERDMQTRRGHSKDIGYTSSPKVEDPIKAQQLYLCQGFAEYCAGTDVKAEGWEGKHFAAFKFARVFVTADIVGNALRQCKVTFRPVLVRSRVPCLRLRKHVLATRRNMSTRA